MRLELSREAAADLAEIADFTISCWGEQAADEYVDGLQALFASDSAPAARARLVGGRGFKGRGLKRITYRSHFIFFEARDDAILIVRILHRRRDVLRHLP